MDAPSPTPPTSEPDNTRLRAVLWDRILPLLEDGAIALIRSDWLISFDVSQLIPPCLPHRRLLEERFPEAFVRPNELTYGARSVECLSYMWLSEEHPDPFVTTLLQVQTTLKTLRWDGEEDCRGIFWDYLSLYQKPRNVEEEAAFERGLTGIGLLFMHPDVDVLQVTEHPKDKIQLLTKHNATPYHQRGWPVVEQSLASLVKGRFKVFNLSLWEWTDKEGEESPDSNALIGQCGADLKRNPLLPSQFHQLLSTLSFSNGKEDSERVQELYRGSFEFLFTNVVKLDFSYQGWKDGQAQKSLYEILLKGHAPALRSLDLANNRLGASFCEQLASAFSRDRTTTPLALHSLHLSRNPIGDKGVSFLAEAVVQMWNVDLTEVGLTETGCRALADAWQGPGTNGHSQKKRKHLSSLEAASKNRSSHLQYLALDRNHIGDEGVTLLAPFLVQLTQVSLDKVGLSDSGCKRLLQCRKEAGLQFLSLQENKIASISSFEVIANWPSLKELAISGNPCCRNERERAHLHRLLEICHSTGVELRHETDDTDSSDSSTQWSTSEKSK